MILCRLWELWVILFFPFSFIGEEAVSLGGKCELLEEATWIIDPVDGTMNFVHSFPHSAISIALYFEKVNFITALYGTDFTNILTNFITLWAHSNNIFCFRLRLSPLFTTLSWTRCTLHAKGRDHSWMKNRYTYRKRQNCAMPWWWQNLEQAEIPRNWRWC